MSIPRWARDKAAALNVAEPSSCSPNDRLRNAFARYISEHEQPPVDPIQLALAEVFDGCGARALARFHAELVKHGLQITPVQRKEI